MMPSKPTSSPHYFPVAQVATLTTARRSPMVRECSPMGWPHVQARAWALLPTIFGIPRFTNFTLVTGERSRCEPERTG
jgi:hypothetical protein